MKLAVIGTGKIVEEALYAIEPIQDIEIKAIFGRPHSKEKAAAFAEKYKISEVYTDYAELLEKSDVDAVYIGLVNSVHYSYAREALLHDRDVILEKPFTTSLAEALDLEKTAQERGLILMEAVTVLHDKTFENVKNNLSRIGQPKLVLCNYSQYSSRYDAYLKGEITPVFDPDMKGGAVRDLNVYNIHWCVGLFGSPETLFYYPNRGFNGVDTSGVLVMQYNGFICVCAAAKDSDSPGFVSIQGEKGWMRINGKPNAPEELLTAFEDSADDECGDHTQLHRDSSGSVLRKMTESEFHAPEVYHRMTKEFEDFAEMVRARDTVKAGELLDETISVVRILDEL